MAAFSGFEMTGPIESVRWYKWFSIFGKVDMYGKKIRGIIYCKHTQVTDCERTLNFYAYVTKKQMFK